MLNKIESLSSDEVHEAMAKATEHRISPLSKHREKIVDQIENGKSVK